MLTTNTFGANRVALAKYGLAEKTGQINRAGARLAREVADRAGRPVFVAGSIGPLPPQPQHEDALAGMIVEQATALLEGGADFIIFETQPTRGGDGGLGGGHAAIARRRPSCFRRRSWAMRIGLRGADRADAGAAADGTAPCRSPGD